MELTISSIREKISKGKTTVAIEAFKSFLEKCELEDLEKSGFKQSLVLISSRLAKYKSDKINGEVMHVDDPAYNRIIGSLTDLILEVENCLPEDFDEKKEQHPVFASGSEAILTKVKEQRIEITIDADFSSFSEADQKRVMEALGKFLEMDGPIEIKKKRKGSVKLQLDLPPDKAEKLLWAIRRGEFSDLKLESAELISEGEIPIWNPKKIRLQPWVSSNDPALWKYERKQILIKLYVFTIVLFDELVGFDSFDAKDVRALRREINLIVRSSISFIHSNQKELRQKQDEINLKYRKVERKRVAIRKLKNEVILKNLEYIRTDLVFFLDLSNLIREVFFQIGGEKEDQLMCIRSLEALEEGMEDLLKELEEGERD